MPTQKRSGVEMKVKHLLNVREKFKDQSLADLYDPVAMPKELVKAHQQLDKAVDQCYHSKAFENELSRLQFLFNLYKKYREPLLVVEKKGS